MRKATQARVPDEGSDAQLLARLAAGDHVAFEALMRRHNQRLFRVARALLRDDQEAEDAVQEAYLSAYRHAASFRGDAQVSTWLSRIVVNGCLMRLRQRRSHPVLVPFPPGAIEDAPAVDGPMHEEGEPQYRDVLRAEVRRLLERRIDELPPIFRAVFVMREVEDMTGQEVADALSLPVATVRTRLFRARAMLRASLERDMDTAAGNVFAFAGDRCDRIVATVLARVAAGDVGVDPGDEPA